jgi:hypothetical protein
MKKPPTNTQADPTNPTMALCPPKDKGILVSSERDGSKLTPRDYSEKDATMNVLPT